MIKSPEITRVETTNKKPGYDSRLHFSRYLVELRHHVILESQKGIFNWLSALRLFHSNCQGITDPEKMKTWLEQFTKILEQAKQDKPKNPYSKVKTWNKRIGEYYVPRILELQDDIFILTAHLFLPLSESDREDFDPREIIGDGDG